MEGNRFKVGSRVVRNEDVFSRKSKLMHGTVVRVYAYQSVNHGFYPEVYAVKWDHRNDEDDGYLPHGINAEGHP